MKPMARSIPAAAAMALLAAPGIACADDGGWDWMIQPYGWFATVGTDIRTLQPPTEAGSETTFRDIIDKLDGVFQMRVEGRGDRFGLFADFTYLGLGDEQQRERMSTESDLDTRLFDFAGSWRPGGERDTGLDLFAGIRYLDVDLAVRFTPNDPAFQPRSLDNSRSYTDFLAGARHTWAFSERWGMTLRGDVSTGDTDGTWSVAAMGHYRTGNGMWVFGYRHLEVELGRGRSNLDATITMSGPQVGYGFIF